MFGQQRRRRPLRGLLARGAARARCSRPTAAGTSSRKSSSHGDLKLKKKNEHQKSLLRRKAARWRSQSPSVESATWRTPAAESMRTRPVRSSAAATANRSRSVAVARVDAQLAAGLRIDEPQLADVGELLLARVADLDRERRMAAGDAQQRVPPVDRAAEVGDDHDERALHREPVEEQQRLGEPALAGRLVAQRRERQQQAAPALPGTAPARILGAERDEPEPVAAPRRGVADRERDALGDVGLPPVGGAERHRGGAVEDEPGDEHALGELDADVRLRRCGR